MCQALDSGDTDLVYLVLLHSLRYFKEDPTGFFAILQNKPVAIKLLVKYAWQKDPDLLRQIFQFTGEVEREGDLAVRKALLMADPEKKARMLTYAIEGTSFLLPLDLAHNQGFFVVYEKSKNAGFQKSICLDEVRLLRLQMDLETASADGSQYVGKSVGETLKLLVEAGQDKKVDNLVKEFKIPETRVYWTKVMALAARGKWEALRKLGDEKKPPIGWAPFAEAAFENGNVREARDYVKKVHRRLRRARIGH